MAPRETVKMTPKSQRNVIVNNSKTKSSPYKFRTLSNRKNKENKIYSETKTKRTQEKTCISSEVISEQRARTNTVPTSAVKCKENKSTPITGSVTKKSTWKRRPKPAHSGVPVPEKMKKLIGKQLQDLDCSL